MSRFASVRRRLSFSTVLALIFGAPLWTGAAPAAPQAPAPHSGRLAVEVEGSVPGLAGGALGTYVADAMNKANIGGWQFMAGTASSDAVGRVQWSFKTGPSANGALRTYGFSRATMERLIGAHYYVTIEAKLFLGGEYQTETLGQVTLGAQSPDPDFGAKIETMTRLIMSYPDSQGRLFGDRVPVAGLLTSGSASRLQ